MSTTLISARDAADLLGVNRATVINWANQGRFAAIQFGRRGIYRFDRHDIECFIEASRLTHPTDEPTSDTTTDATNEGRNRR